MLESKELLKHIVVKDLKFYDKDILRAKLLSYTQNFIIKD